MSTQRASIKEGRLGGGCSSCPRGVNSEQYKAGVAWVWVKVFLVCRPKN